MRVYRYLCLQVHYIVIICWQLIDIAFNQLRDEQCIIRHLHREKCVGKMRAVYGAADACPCSTLCMEFHIMLRNPYVLLFVRFVLGMSCAWDLWLQWSECAQDLTPSRDSLEESCDAILVGGTALNFTWRQSKQPNCPRFRGKQSWVEQQGKCLLCFFFPQIKPLILQFSFSCIISGINLLILFLLCIPQCVGCSKCVTASGMGNLVTATA